MQQPDLPEILPVITCGTSVTVIHKFRSFCFQLTGMCFAFLTTQIAARVEIFRLSECIESSVAAEYSIVLVDWLPCFRARAISVAHLYAQFPQDIAMGFTQLFRMLACFEFAYFVALRSTQSLFMIVFTFARSASGMISPFCWYPHLGSFSII